MASCGVKMEKLAGNPRRVGGLSSSPDGEFGASCCACSTKSLPHCCVNLREGGTECRGSPGVDQTASGSRGPAARVRMEPRSHALHNLYSHTRPTSKMSQPAQPQMLSLEDVTTCTPTHADLKDCQPTVIRELGLRPDPGLGEDEPPPTLGTRASGLSLKLLQLSACRLET